MSAEYDAFLEQHRKNVKKGYNWLKRSLPEVIPKELEPKISLNIDLHDDTKENNDEYQAYDEYFYGKRSKLTEQKMRYAWLYHIHQNPHHWQYWVLITDDQGVVRMDMPYEYIIEMICDWWSFSWANDNVWEIFDYYESQKKNMKLSKRTKDTVEDILDKLEKKLTKVRGERK